MKQQPVDFVRNDNESDDSEADVDADEERRLWLQDLSMARRIT